MSLSLQPTDFYGALSKTLQAPNLSLHEIIHPPEQKTPEHLHERPYFSLTVQGDHTKVYGQQRVQCTPQTLVFHPPYQRQSGYCGKMGGRSFLIGIEPGLLDQLSSYPLIIDRLAIFREGPIIWFARRLYSEFCLPDELSAITIEGLLLEMLAEASRPASKKAHRRPQHWLARADQVIRTRFSESLTTRDIAKSVGVHPVYLASEFRRTFHTTIGERIRKLRIDFACRKIATGDVSLAQIALDSGFSSQSHFSTAFKRLTGLTPSDYRAMFR